MTFTDAASANTTVTIDENYSGADTPTITALSSDNEPPVILPLTTEGGFIKATAQDNDGGAEYVFAAAESADDVTDWISADNTTEQVQSFSFEPEAGGRYRFFAKDSSSNTSVSDGYIDVTMITYHGYSDGNGVSDKTACFFGDSLTLPEISRDAWVFKGWHKLSDLSDEAVSTVYCDTENGVELYAEWAEQTLVIPDLAPIVKTYDAQEETLSVTLSHTGVLTYQWYKDGTAIEGATSSSLTVKNVADSGSYHVCVELKQADGTVIGSGSSGNATVDIRRAPLTVKADDDEITFGSEAPGSYSVTISGFVGSEGREVVSDGTVTCSYEKGDNAGEYAIVPAGFSAANYDIEHRNGTLTVREKTGTLTAELADPDAEYFYAPDTAHTPAVIVKDGGTLLTENRDYVLKYTDNIKAGTATITITYKGNYSGVDTLHFVIKRSGVSPVLKTADKVYGESDAVAWLEGVPSDSGEVTYYYAGADSEDYSTVQPSDAGSYKVYAVVADTSDYLGFTTPVGTFEIKKRSIKITANSAVFSYDGTEHSDSGYEIEGTFVVGQGFKSVTVTGSVINVTAPGSGVVNKITYELSPTTNPDNYDITAVDGLLQVTSLSLTVPSGLGWSSTAGTASWVPVKKNNLIVKYALDLYAYDGNDYTKINDDRIIVDASSYAFAPAIVAHASAAAEQGKTYSYTFRIQTLSAGGESQSGYTDSEVSDYQAMMYTAEVSISSDSSMVSSAAVGGTDRLILLNGQRVNISAVTRDGYVFDDPALTSTPGFSVGTPDIKTPTAHKESSLSASITAKLTSSQLGGVVTVHAVDEKPWISSFTAENEADYQSVKLRFTAADGNDLTMSLTAPALNIPGLVIRTAMPAIPTRQAADLFMTPRFPISKTASHALR